MGPWGGDEYGDPQYGEEWDEEPQAIPDNTRTRTPASRTPIRRGGAKRPATEQPRDRSWTYNDCRTCGKQLNHKEATTKSGRCSNCHHHGTTDSTQDPTAPYYTRPETAGYGGEDEEKRWVSYGDENKLGGYGGDGDDGHWFNFSHRGGNDASWKRQPSSK